MTNSGTVLQIPDELKPADGRFGSGPSRIRPEQLGRLAQEGAGGDGNLAPSGAGQGRGRRRSEPVCASCSPSPTATRSCSATAAPPRSGTPRPARWSASARCNLVYGEFSSKFAACTRKAPVPRRPDRDRGRARRCARAAVRPGRRRDRLGPQRDLDRRDGPGLEARRRGRRAGAGRRDVGRGRAAGRRRPDRRLLLRAPEGPRLRRRAVARAAQPARARAHRADRRG